MNQHFDFSRFSRLLRRHTAEHLRAYLMGVAVLVGGVVAVLGGVTYLGGRPLHPAVQLVLFEYGLLSAGAMFTAAVFAAIGDQSRAAPALLLPASHLEKYLVVWLYSLPVFMVVYTVVFLAVDALTLQLGAAGYPRQLLSFSEEPHYLVQALLRYAVLHAAALWCAIYFKRQHVIRMAFVVFGLGGALTLLNFQVLKRLLTPGIAPTLPFSSVRIAEGGQLFSLALPTTHPALFVLLPLVLALLLWAGAYARLTEKQL
ncbi:hypothetical protein [Hymenobacter sp. YC55]|uniref:hypothetical protein n=1 Tax=Hymenobacter sp. YC55 TaxID=3034019 RepID=UPI0023F924C7|nr:hypothetical protein [Hymenobacter sp. YC55]MDF7813424.1 hypothetical protein [Hymenobacter sp. YC55]